jgi:8-oxo-dGTP diphosphatase
MPDNSSSQTISINDFFRGAFSVDIVIFTFHDGQLKVLLQEKDEVPFTNELGLIGKLMLPNEDADEVMKKLMLTTLGFNDFYSKELTAFSDVGRHPLGRVVTFAYYGLLPWERFDPTFSNRLAWHTMDQIPVLSYDHNQILNAVVKRFRKGLLRHPTVFELLSPEFTLADVIAVYEQAFGKKVDAPNFRKQIRKSALIKPTGKYLKKTNYSGRPPELYTFDKKQYGQLKDRVQFNF